MSPKDFKHKISLTVRFNEVDMLGVCNNAVYINYFEHARLQYIKEIGLLPEKGIFSDVRLFFVVRNEINYYNYARYDDQLTIYTRIPYIKNSSFGFEHLVEKGNQVIADGKGVIVHVDPKTRKSAPLPEEFYERVSKYESNVKILRDEIN
ncbi:MAG TPA: thioesterase family protein [Ignavibacteriaceae bacterium]|nr:thioesterase family protein [Ignavibacteriaceae bacterium]